MMNTIQSPNNATTMMKRTKTSILPDPMEGTNAIEILGHYWPRVLRNQNLNSVAKGKNNDKKVIKKGTIRLHRRKTDIKKVLSIVPASPLLLSSPFAPLSPSSSSSSVGGCPSTPTTTTTTKDVICPSSFLVLDGGEFQHHHQQQQRTFSPITGRPISPVCIKKTTCCSLLPDKSLRAMIHQNRRLRRRSSKSHHHSHQQVLQH